MRSSFNSIQTQVLIRFLAILLFILSLTWLLQIVCFKWIFENVKTAEVMRACDIAVQTYNNNDMDGLLRLSVKTECNIVIVEMVGQNISIAFNSSRVTDDLEIKKSFYKLIEKLGERESVSYKTEEANFVTLTFGREVKLDDRYYYIFVNSNITPIDSTLRVMNFLFALISVTAVILTVLLSLFFSMRLSSPIKRLARQARKLSRGDTNVRFNAREFDETSELTDALNYSLVEIKKSELLQREVVANVSHEIRTPLTMIKSYAELIQDFSGDDEEKRKEHLQIIVDEANRLEYILNDILDLSKISAGTATYQMGEFDLSELVLKYVDLFKNKEPNFVFNVDVEPNAFINGDEKRIGQVVTNLINNAINYSGELKQIDISLIKENGLYKFAVKDYGIGISKEDQKAIFDRHFRAINAKRMAVGSGIGLSIVKGILEYHKFDYGVKSELNKGSTFYFYAKPKE